MLVSRRSMRNLIRAAHRSATGKYGCEDTPCPHPLNIETEPVRQEPAPPTPKTPGSRRSVEGHRRITLERLERKEQRGEPLTEGQRNALKRLRRAVTETAA